MHDADRSPPDGHPPPGARGGALGRAVGRWWVLGLGVLIAGSVAWVALHGSNADRPVLAPSEAVAGADRLAGRTVVVAGQVHASVPQGLVLRGRERGRELLVLVEPDAELEVRRGQPVWVSGSIQRFTARVSAFAERVDDPPLRRFEGRPVVLASEVSESAPVR